MFTTEFYAIDIDMAAYRKAVLEYLRELNEKAGQAWLNEVIKGTPIPTWSGASRATFQKLARELNTTVPIGIQKSKKNRVPLGLSTSAGSGVEERNYPTDIYVGFLYETSLRYLAYNEYNRAVAGPPPQPYSNNVRFTPYGFQKRASKVWQAEAKKARLPNPYDYILNYRI
jgi:hypothetical protein